MELDLAGRRAFISGSTHGIGWSIARALLAEGAEVILNGRSAEGVAAAVDSLRGAAPGARVSGVAADFADADDVSRLLERLERIDILVNNVGMFGVHPFGDTDDRRWQRYLETNLMSGVRLSRHLLPGMLATGWGRILFISSESGVDVPADMVAYGASKAATLGLANGLAKSTRGTAVTVNTVLGGPTWSDGVATVVEQMAAAHDSTVDDLKSAIMAGRPTSLLQRFIEPKEIASLVAFLVSPLSSAINGAALRADGGVLPTTL